MNPDYIIVQAGGKGTRMEYLTENKPKSLVPINNLPMLFHLFRKYPNKKFIIIGDYKYEVLKRYLEAFARVKYLLVDARGKQGTCAGISGALRRIPEKEAFMLIWSDLILPETFAFPKEDDNYVGLSGDFRCRWKYENGVFEEEPSVPYGVAGLFIFKDKQQIINVAPEGEFVKWLKETDMHPNTLILCKTKEYGLISEYNKLEIQKCRPFNRMRVEDGKLIKEGIDEQGLKLAIREKGWYRFVAPLGFDKIPDIYSYEPFVMEKIHGKNIYEYGELSREQKTDILQKIVSMLQELHGLGSVPVDYFSMKEAYISKTFARLEQVRNLIPFAEQRYITINGKSCRNVYLHREEFEKQLNNLDAKEFVLLHGDCTFSNMMLKEDTEPVLIDPRGYFGYTEMYGDVAYDWAKLYYSLAGNYDQFNRKAFRLHIGEKEVKLEIESNHWEDMEDTFFELVKEDVTKEQIQLIHAVIWLSLTTYAWEDYDSICGAFYNGLYYLEDVLS